MLEANWFIRFAAQVQEYVVEERKLIKIAFGSVSWTFTTPKLIFLLTSEGETTEKAKLSHLYQFMYLVCTCIKTIVSNEEIKTCETNLCHTRSSNELALYLTEGTQLSRIRGAKGRWRRLAQTPMFA